jgi:hypothetical protein
MMDSYEVREGTYKKCEYPNVDKKEATHMSAGYDMFWYSHLWLPLLPLPAAPA